MAKFKIGWNDGHTLSGNGTGAAKIVKETDRNRRIGILARKYLLEYENVEIVNCTIDKSENDMYEAVTKANNTNCDLFVSNHVNAGGGRGFETFYSRKSTQDNINKAKIIHKNLVATKSCLMDRRCTDDYSYKGYDLYVLINTKMDAVLCEIGFVDNQECVNAVNDDEVARAYVAGIAEAYGLKKKVATSISTVITSATTVSNSSELYRVRKSWVDALSQKGAYTFLDSAKKNCPSGYSVFDSKGNKIYQVENTTNTNIKVEVKVDYIIQYSNSVDQAIAEVMADRLNCPTINCLRPYAYYGQYKTVIAVGEAKNRSGYTNVVIDGSNRKETLDKAIEYCVKQGK